MLEPSGSAAHDWSTAVCRTAGFEPDVRYLSTDLQIHLTLVADGPAAALVPNLSGAATRDDVAVHRLPGRPAARPPSSPRSAPAPPSTPLSRRSPPRSPRPITS